MSMLSRRTAYPPILVALAVLLLHSVSPPSWAGKFNKALSIGDAAPAWNGLPGVDDQAHSVGDVKDAKVLVVVFICNHCPIATAHEERLIQLQKDYADKRVKLVAISVSRQESDRLDKMKIRAKERGFNFPYLSDETQQIGRQFGALATPEAFVLDANRKVVYMGAMDDQLDAKAVTKPYLRNAIDAVLAGQAPAVTETRPVGCEIDYQ